MTQRRILFATDVPFWLRSSGAEQRIFAMHQFLKRDGHSCSVFFLGELGVVDRECVKLYEIEVFENSSDRPPVKLFNRIRWYADATIHQARNWLNRDRDSIQNLDGPGSLTLDDFTWPWAAIRFHEVVASNQPDVIIFEYIKTSYLLDAIDPQQRSRIHCLIDTHDVLYQRAEQFFANGFPHWLKIDRSQESLVLQKFDAVMAIQEHEAKTFREMVRDQTRTITVGHAVDCADDLFLEVNADVESPKKIIVGYIGSKNFSNWQAIRDFLNYAWPSVIARNQETCELVVAGAICDWFDADDQGHIYVGSSNRQESGIEPGSGIAVMPTPVRNMRLLGRIDRVESFYDEIDVVINPVMFGTGLKIKNAESLRYGKLLITTLNGFVGMPETTRLACMVVESINEMGLAINSICSDLSRIRPMQQLALQLAQTEFSEAQAYSELKAYLDE